MKKTLALVLAAFMSLALVACGGSPASSKPAANSEKPASSVAASQPAAPASSQPQSQPAAPADACPFAGEYDLYSEGKNLYCEEFIIEADGTVHGVVESSGLTSFEGTVAEDGTITAEVTRLGGTMTGTITEDLQVTVHFEVRGSSTDFTGGPL